MCPSLEPWVDYPAMNICWATTLGSIATVKGSLLAGMKDELLAHLTNLYTFGSGYDPSWIDIDRHPKRTNMGLLDVPPHQPSQDFF